MNRDILVSNRKIGFGHPVFIVAEVSANHNQSIERAKSIIRAAAEAGADAVKLQTYTADTMTIACDRDEFQITGGLWDGRTLHDLYRQAYTPWEWQPELKKLADEAGIILFSTPFDPTSVDFLEKMEVAVHKIASFELLDMPLIKKEKVAATGKPVIMSTGMASLAEIDEAVRTVRENGTEDLILLKCTSSYPAVPEEINLRTIPHLAEAFGCPVGLSDHTMGSAVAVAAVALGARVIEKHFTLSRADGGPDGSFSMEPAEFKQMVRDIRIAEKALGRVNYDLTEQEQSSVVFRRSLFVVEDVRAGEPFTEKNVRSIRPGHGLHTRFYDDVLRRKALRDIKKGTPLSWELCR